MGRAKPDKQMVTTAKRDIGIFHIQQDLFENRIPAGRPENEGGFLLQQRYDKSKRCNIGREPQHRRHRNYGIPERTITPSKLPKQESAPRVSSWAGFAKKHLSFRGIGEEMKIEAESEGSASVCLFITVSAFRRP